MHAVINEAVCFAKPQPWLHAPIPAATRYDQSRARLEVTLWCGSPPLLLNSPIHVLRTAIYFPEAAFLSAPFSCNFLATRQPAVTSDQHLPCDQPTCIPSLLHRKRHLFNGAFAPYPATRPLETAKY